MFVLSDTTLMERGKQIAFCQQRNKVEFGGCYGNAFCNPLLLLISNRHLAVLIDVQSLSSAEHKLTSIHLQFDAAPATFMQIEYLQSFSIRFKQRASSL